MNSKAIVQSTFAALLATAVLGVTSAAAAVEQPEKCYGIVKAGKNDFQTASSSCAGTSKSDAQADAWIYVPKGTCEKIVGGSLEPKSS
jgi:uncharacterized membrane protein